MELALECLLELVLKKLLFNTLLKRERKESLRILERRFRSIQTETRSQCSAAVVRILVLIVSFFLLMCGLANFPGWGKFKVWHLNYNSFAKTKIPGAKISGPERRKEAV